MTFSLGGLGGIDPSSFSTGGVYTPLGGVQISLLRSTLWL